MPVYNCESFVDKSIESIVNQTYKNIEFIIINDGSTDNSESIIKRYTYKDKRIIYLKNENNFGLAYSLNKGIQHSNGYYIARMDADDISLPKRLQIQYEFMEENQEIGLCGTWIKCFGILNQLNKNHKKDSEIRLKLLFDSAIAHPTFFMRSSLIKDNYIKYCDIPYNSWNKTNSFCEDYDFIVKLWDLTKYANIQKPLLKYRTHKNSISGTNNYNKRKDGRIYVLRKLFMSKLGFDIQDIDLETHLEFIHFVLYKDFIKFKKQYLWLRKFISIFSSNEKKFIKILIMQKYLIYLKIYFRKAQFISFIYILYFSIKIKIA